MSSVKKNAMTHITLCCYVSLSHITFLLNNVILCKVLIQDHICQSNFSMQAKQYTLYQYNVMSVTQDLVISIS